METSRFLLRSDRRRSAAAIAGALALALAPSVEAGAAVRPGADSAPLVDLDGRPVDPLAKPAVATVFVFLRTDCPISNRYAPELRRIWEELAPRGVVFYGVHPDPDEPVDEIRRSVEELGLPFPALRDPRHRLVERTGATVTPEVAVFDDRERLVYRGRVDDRWASLGRPRPAPTERDLVEVLDRLLAGERLVPRTTRAVGCYIPPLPPSS